MKKRFMDERAEYRMLKQLSEMNGKLKAEAIRKLKGILNIWSGKACAREMYNMISAWTYDKRIAHIGRQADEKLKKVRKWKFFGQWIQYLNQCKEDKHWKQFEDMKKEIKELKDALSVSEEEMQRLMERFLGTRHSAFFDKIDRVMKAWRFGTFGMMFSDWQRWTKDTVKERLESHGKATRDELLANLAAAQAEMEAAKKRITLLEAEALENGKSISVRDNEIAMLREKTRSLEARTTTLYDQGFADGNKDKEEALSKLMEKFLLTAQGAFLDKINEILMAWKFGTLGYMWSSWKSYVSAKKTRDASIEGKLAKSEADLAEANKKIAELEAQLAQLQKDKAASDAEWIRKGKQLQDKIDDLETEVAGAIASAKAAKEKLKDEVENLTKKCKKDVEDAQAETDTAEKGEIDAKKDAATVRTEKAEIAKHLDAVKTDLKKQRADMEERESKMNREVEEAKNNADRKAEKVKLLDEQMTNSENLRGALADRATDLGEKNEKLQLQLEKLKANLELERKENEALRAGTSAGA